MLKDMGEPFTTLRKCCKFEISSSGINSTFRHEPNHFESKQSFLKLKTKTKIKIEHNGKGNSKSVKVNQIRNQENEVASGNESGNGSGKRKWQKVRCLVVNGLVKRIGRSIDHFQIVL